jgi:hypothetical protein
MDPSAERSTHPGSGTDTVHWRTVSKFPEVVIQLRFPDSPHVTGVTAGIKMAVSVGS